MKYTLDWLQSKVILVTFWGSRDVISHVTVQLAVGYFLWVAQCDQLTMRLSCTVMEI